MLLHVGHPHWALEARRAAWEARRRPGWRWPSSPHTRSAGQTRIQDSLVCLLKKIGFSKMQGSVMRRRASSGDEGAPWELGGAWERAVWTLSPCPSFPAPHSFICQVDAGLSERGHAHQPQSQPCVLLGKRWPIGKTKRHSDCVAEATGHTMGGAGPRPHREDTASELGGGASWEGRECLKQRERPKSSPGSTVRRDFLA